MQIFLKRDFYCFLFCSLIISSQTTYSADWDFRGQFSALAGIGKNDNSTNTQFGLRYVPEGSFTKNISDKSFIESLLAFNLHYSSFNKQTSQDLKLYRLHFRFATSQSETRIGMQKISFGPAQLLRSLRWFDRLDPTDPLNLTEGVCAFRYKYYFENNTNLWFWTLYGNDDLKGYDFNPTNKNKPEFGGRFQSPLLNGEVGLTSHFRKAKSEGSDYTESRLAADGRWDLLIGMWFEAVTQKSNTNQIEYPWLKQVTVGADFTFAIGSGLYVLAEHMFASVSEEFTSNNQILNNSAITFSYPVGIFDSFSCIGFYSWQDERFFQYFNWQRTFDDFMLNFSFYAYPANDTISMVSPYSGYGAQIMLIYNH